MTVVPAVVAAPVPVPPERGRWRVTLHRRTFNMADSFQETQLVELSDARSRSLELELNKPAQFSFTINGSSSQAPPIVELATEIYVWRWDEQAGADVCMFRGVVDHAEDQVTEQSAVVTFVAHDTLALLSRRIVIDPQSYLQIDQDQLVYELVEWAQDRVTGYDTTGAWSGGPNPGSFLGPLGVHPIAPDGTARPYAGRLRDYVAAGNTPVLDAIDAVASMIDGFDYDVHVEPVGTPVRYWRPWLRIFYPRQGVTRPDCPLMYGSTVSAFTRTVASSDYANWVRVVGNNETSDAAAPQLDANAWNVDRNNVTVNPVGLWMLGLNESDVSIQSTLNDKANGYLNYYGLLVPSYTVTMRPDAYRYGFPNMGDDVPFIAKVGRLDVDTTLRVVGISYAVGDDGDEDVKLTVGRTARSLASLFTRSQRDIDALARR